MDFDDMTFAHMLKDYSVFSFIPRLSYAIWNWFVSLLLFNRVHGNEYPMYNNQCGMKARVVWQSCVSYSVTSSSPRSKCRIAELAFLVSLSSGISAPRHRYFSTVK